MNVIRCHLCGSNCQTGRHTEAVKHGNTELPSDSTVAAYAANLQSQNKQIVVNLESIWLVPLQNSRSNARQHF